MSRWYLLLRWLFLCPRYSTLLSTLLSFSLDALKPASARTLQTMMQAAVYISAELPETRMSPVYCSRQVSGGRVIPAFTITETAGESLNPWGTLVHVYRDPCMWMHWIHKHTGKKGNANQLHSLKKCTKAVTGVVLFRKVHFCTFKVLIWTFRYKAVPSEKVPLQWQLLYCFFYNEIPATRWNRIYDDLHIKSQIFVKYQVLWAIGLLDWIDWHVA